jgi:uncharacterized membrane protein
MNRRPLLTAGVLLGIGMGGFIDGILFHQVLQLHSMLSAKLPQESLVNVKTSMVWDGLFHAFTWMTTAAGITVLWNAVKRKETPRNGRFLMGAMIGGWGIFNLIEGLVDHYLLQVHHVVERLGLSVYDHLFIASGAFFMVIGFMMVKKSKVSIEEPLSGFFERSF